MHRPMERQIMALGLVIVLAATVFDLWEDSTNGNTLGPLLGELIVPAIISALLFYIYALEPLKLWRENGRFAARAQKQSEDIARLSVMARKQLEGLGAYVDAQFDSWGLTHAEKDVALMLLKGFSMREIAELREVTERTTRQQATTIYGKANLPGRAALSAFFLEDLLLPPQSS